MHTNRIALYLSGQYPSNYRLPNRLDVIFKIRQLDPTNFGDTMVGLLQGKSDLEFFNTLLETFNTLHPDKYSNLLERLHVPEEVRIDPMQFNSEADWRGIQKLDLQKISTYLDKAKEADFSRYVVMPILQAMGYETVEYKGTVKEADKGTDFYVLRYISPVGLNYYTGVQIKSVRMTTWTSTKIGSEFWKLVSEVKAAFADSHINADGKLVKIDEMLIFNSKYTRETVKTDFFNCEDFATRKIKFFGPDGVLSLITNLHFEKDVFSTLI